MAVVGLPLTGSGDATANVAVDLISTEAYQRIKLFDGTEGSTVPIVAKATTPASGDGGMVVRPIGSTAFTQAVRETNPTTAVNVANPTTLVDAQLTSAGSTRLVGVNNYESFTVASRTSVASSADVSLFAANTAHRARIIQNQATGVELLLNLSTVAVSSASSGSDIRIPANGYVVFGGQTGNFPLYVGAVRCKVASTAVNTVAIGLALTT